VIALLWNLSFAELAVILIVAVMVFGKRLPQVAGEAFRGVTRLRRHLDDLRRDSGIDREIFDVKRSFRDVAREVEAEPTRENPYPGNPVRRVGSEDRREANAPFEADPEAPVAPEEQTDEPNEPAPETSSSAAPDPKTD
jgi:Sec-independent protein translocase protein TatA